MPCEKCAVMGMNRNVDGCPAGSAAVSTRHNIKTRAFHSVTCVAFIYSWRCATLSSLPDTYSLSIFGVVWPPAALSLSQSCFPHMQGTWEGRPFTLTCGDVYLVR